MSDRDRYLQQEDRDLLADCKVETYRASGPGGQHRNKVSSAVRLTHEPTGTVAHGNDSRSQHENKQLACKRLRQKLALSIRQPADLRSPPGPPLSDFVFVPKKPTPGKGRHRLAVGRKNRQFWPVAAWLLDGLQAAEGRLGPVAAWAEISTSNLVSVLRSDRHLWAATQELRRAHGHKPLT